MSTKYLVIHAWLSHETGVYLDVIVQTYLGDQTGVL